MVDYTERSNIKNDLIKRFHTVNTEIRTLGDTIREKNQQIQNLSNRIPHYQFALEEAKDDSIKPIYQEPLDILLKDKERLEADVVAHGKTIIELQVMSRRLDTEIKKYN